MDLLYLTRLDTMASASLDSNICIWDLYTGRRQHLLRGHRLGVSSLAYCAERRLLVSAGFDHEVRGGGTLGGGTLGGGTMSGILGGTLGGTVSGTVGGQMGG